MPPGPHEDLVTLLSMYPPDVDDEIEFRPTHAEVMGTAHGWMMRIRRSVELLTSEAGQEYEHELAPIRRSACPLGVSQPVSRSHPRIHLARVRTDWATHLRSYKNAS